MDKKESGSTALLDVRRVAAMLDCSPRSVYRLSDAGRMPQPVKLSAMVRWRRIDLDTWIGDGCPDLRKTKRGNGVSK